MRHEGRSRVPAAGSLLILAGLMTLAATQTGTPAPAAPLTNEDIVRMTSAGTPPESIIEAIQGARVVAFDLEPEIVIELRRAGVAEAVIEAMKKARPDEPAPPEPAASGITGRLEMIFEPAETASDDDRTAVLLAKDRSGKSTSAAFYVYCVDPTHVPDLWQNLTPLASGFPRHRLLWFHEATVPSKKRHGREFHALELPHSVTLDVPAGIHPLEFGVAARSGLGPWISLAETAATLKVTPAAGSRVVLRVRTKRAGGEREDKESPYSCDILRIESLDQRP